MFFVKKICCVHHSTSPTINFVASISRLYNNVSGIKITNVKVKVTSVKVKVTSVKVQVTSVKVKVTAVIEFLNAFIISYRHNISNMLINLSNNSENPNVYNIFINSSINLKKN